MKSSTLHRGAQLALLSLISSALGAPMLALGEEPAAAPEVTAPQMIDAFEGTFGVHPGQRRNHIKGTCAAGEFVGRTETSCPQPLGIVLG